MMLMSHNIILTIMVNVMYSVSAELNVTADCSLLPKQIRVLLSLMSHPVLDLRVALQLAQSESTSPLRFHGSDGDLPVELNSSPKSAVCLTLHIMLRRARKCSGPCLPAFANCDATPMLTQRSGRVNRRYPRDPI